MEGAGRLELALGGAIGGLVQGGAAGALEWLGKGVGKAIREAQGARRRRGSRGEGIFHGGSGFYPRSVVPAADEDVRATPAGKQLRGQARGSAGRGGSAPTAEHPPARAL